MRRLVFCTLILGLGCGGERASGDGDAAAADAASAAAAGPMGQASVAGTISFEGAVPANPAIDMAEEPDCVAKYQGAPTDPQVLVANGKLADVFVYVKSGLPAGATYAAPSSPVVLDQDGCLYKPRVLGVMPNQEIEIRNSDPLLHNIKAVPSANRGFNISQPSEGMTTKRKFATPEVMVPLECNVHGWMNAYVGVVAHPFFAVSAADGSFTIANLPAGTYELEAWHEKFGTQTLSITVPDTGEVPAAFTFRASAS